MVKKYKALVLSVLLGCCLAFPLAGCSTETYTPAEKTPVVAVPVIGKEGVLRVGVNANNHPFAGQGTAGIVGINVDIAAAIADELGLKLEVVDVGTDPESALESGAIDIAMGIDKTDSTVSFWTSDAYIQSAVALFASSTTTVIPTKDSAPKIAAQTSSMSAWEVNKQFGQDALVSSQDLKTAFSDLSSGLVGYVAADAVIGSFAVKGDFSEDVSIIALMQKPNGYAIGVLDANADLKQMISDTLVTLQGNGMLSLVETKWLGRPIDLSSISLAEGATALPVEEVVDAEEDEATENEEEGEAGSNAVQPNAV